MNTQSNRRGGWLLGAGLLLFLMALPLVLTYRSARQQQLNRDLIAAARRNSTSVVRNLTGTIHAEEIEQTREVVACLLGHGASVHDKDSEGNTAMSLARMVNDQRILQMLKKATGLSRGE